MKVFDFLKRFQWAFRPRPTDEAAAKFLHQHSGRVSGTFTAPEVIAVMQAWRAEIVPTTEMEDLTTEQFVERYIKPTVLADYPDHVEQMKVMDRWWKNFREAQARAEAETDAAGR